MCALFDNIMPSTTNPKPKTSPPITRSRSNSNSNQSPELLIVNPSVDDINWYNESIAKSDSNENLTDISSLARLLKLALNTNLITQQIVKQVTEDTTNVKRRLSNVENNLVRLEQYSRKDVAILTGVEYEEGETTNKLVNTVLNHLNAVDIPQEITYKDFSAVHRNGRKGKGGKPPSVTLNFLRLYEKELFFHVQTNNL